jgi:hypothetical protein
MFRSFLDREDFRYSLFRDRDRRFSLQLLVGHSEGVEPSEVTFLAGLEAINALLRTESSSPRVVPRETKPSITDGASFRCTLPKILGAVVHFRLP